MLALTAFLPTDSPGKISPPQTRRPYAAREITLESNQQNRPAQEASHDHQATDAPATAGPAGVGARRHDQLPEPHQNGNAYLLTNQLGNPDTTVIDGERFIIPEPGTPASASTPTCSSPSTPTQPSTTKTTATSSPGRESPQTWSSKSPWWHVKLRLLARFGDR